MPCHASLFVQVVFHCSTCCKSRKRRSWRKWLKGCVDGRVAGDGVRREGTLLSEKNVPAIMKRSRAKYV